MVINNDNIPEYDRYQYRCSLLLKLIKILLDMNKSDGQKEIIYTQDSPESSTDV